MEGNPIWQEQMKCNFLSHHEDVGNLGHKYAKNSNFKVKHYFTYNPRRRKQTRSQENICSFVDSYQYLGKSFNRVCFQVKTNVNDCPNTVDLWAYVWEGSLNAMTVHCDSWLHEGYKQLKWWTKLKLEIVLTIKQKSFIRGISFWSW